MDKRLCIWTYSSLQLLYELNEISSSCFTIHRTNYLFYTQLNSLYIYDTLNQSKISTRQYLIPFLNDLSKDENEMNIDKIIYSSQSETLILENSDMIYAMHLPQRLFLVRWMPWMVLLVIVFFSRVGFSLTPLHWTDVYKEKTISCLYSGIFLLTTLRRPWKYLSMQRNTPSEECPFSPCICRLSGVIRPRPKLLSFLDTNKRTNERTRQCVCARHVLWLVRTPFWLVMRQGEIDCISISSLFDTSPIRNKLKRSFSQNNDNDQR